MANLKLLACKGCGSVVTEATLKLAGIPYDREEVNYEEPGPARDRLFELNPLGQVPTLVLPTGEVLTETLAIAAWVDRIRPEANLLPLRGDQPPELVAKYWRWAVYIVASIYPTFTFGDSPEKFVGEGEAAKELRDSTDRRREQSWLAVEAEASAPYFLGETFSVIDLYLATMVHWRPRIKWFETNAPKIASIARRVSADPRFAEIFRKNFG